MKKTISFRDLILFEDADFVLINKPAGISTLEDRQTPVNILSLAKAYAGDAQVCHRLDKDTTGVLAIAKNPAAYRHLAMQFEKRTVTKLYHAVADGLHHFEDRLVDLPIAKTDENVVYISQKEGKPAQTRFTSLQAFRQHTLIACEPVTGRMHQIRIHLASLNAPITGDLQYGGQYFYLSAAKRGYNLKKDAEEQPLMRRMALHAFSLAFQDMKGEKIRVEAPYPKDFHALVRQLGLHTKR